MNRILFRRPSRILASIIVCFAASLAGCGGKAPSENSQAANQNGASPAVGQAIVPPTDIVSQFLDRVRRGGSDTSAGELLTELAQNELKRIGRTVQPLGTPDASFQVTRGEAIPDDPNAMLVHSIWREPAQDGANTEFQVVWALQREPAGWRISGLAVESDPGLEPEIINFEDGEQLRQIFAEPAAQTAAAPAAVAR